MSDYEEKRSRTPSPGANAPGQLPNPGKRTLVEQAPVVQRHGNGPVPEAQVHDAASRGVATSTSPLPFAEQIQQSFGRHDVSSVQAHTGADAKASAHAMGADAFATGNHVVLGQNDLHTVAHEVAHVVQQRGGIQLKGGVGEAGDDHERHADEVAELVVQGKSAESVLDRYAGGGNAGASTGPVQRAMRTARVDAEADALYAQKSEAFELGMGPLLAADPDANAGADLMMDAVKKIVDAYAAHTGKGQEATYQQELGWAGGDRYYGALEMTGAAIKDIFNDKSQPLRSKLKVVYNAVRNNNLGKWLEIAAQELQNQVGGKAPADILVHRTEQNVRNPDGSVNAMAPYTNDAVTPGFAAASGLDTVLTGPHLADATAKLASGKWNYGDGRDHVVSGADTYSPLIAPSAALTAANRDRRGAQNAGIALADQQTLKVGDVPDLTDPEVRQIYANQGKPAPDAAEAATYKGRKGDKLPWEQGGQYFDVIPNSDVDLKAAEIRARLEAGVSGSTDLMLHTAQELGLGDAASMGRIRLAMLGWMLQNRDHSFYEVMQASTSYGLPFVTDPTRRGYEYEAPQNFAPMNPAKLRDILPEKQFPGHFASGTSRGEIDHTLTTPDKPASEFRAAFTTAGIPSSVANALDERALADLSILEREVAAASFVAATDDRTAKLNHQQVRQLQRSAPYLSLVHAHPAHAAGMLMALIQHAHGAGALDETEGRLVASQGQLPAVGTSDVGRRQALEDAGVPAGALVGAPDHLISDLVQLLGFVLQAAFDTSPAPTAAATNNAETRRLKQTAPYVNAATALGVLKADLILSSLCQHRHAGLESTVYAPSARGEPLIAAGIPESVVSLNMDPGFVSDLEQLVVAINAVAAGPASDHLAGLQGLAALHPRVAGFLGPQRFNLVVFTVARKAGVALAQGSEEEVMADLGEVLQPNATKIRDDQKDAFDAAATQRYFAGRDTDYSAATGGARQTLDTNLAKYPDIDGDQYEDLTDAELWGINEYTKYGGMGHWQAAIASMNPKDKKMFGLGKVNLKIKAAVSGLNKIKPYRDTVYNGQQGPTGVDRSDPVAVQHWINANYPLGRVIPQPNFLSSAKSVGASFISKAGHDIAWVISNLKTGRDIQPISTNDGEEEVLFPPGAKLLVTKVENKLNDLDPSQAKLWVHLTEV